MTPSLGQHVLAGFDGFCVTAEVRDLILKDKILGFTLFKWNIESGEQLCALTAELRALARQAGYGLVLAVDQEGGRVQRLPEPFSRLKSMRAWAGACADAGSVGHARELGRILGREVRLAGFNLDFAPVVDLDLNPDSPIIGDRSFSGDPDTVTRLARELILGLGEEGVTACLKHFPGHGATNKDSHLELPVDPRPWEDIRARDVRPYRKLMAEGLVASLMTAHVLYPRADAEWPGTLSAPIVGSFLRGELAYDGLVFSDDLLMKAIADRYDLADAARRFITIGGDVALVCKEPGVSRDIVAKLSREKDPAFLSALSRAARRVAAFKARLPQDEPAADWAVLEKHRDYLARVFG